MPNKQLTTTDKIEALRAGVERILAGEPSTKVWINIGEQYGVHKATLQGWLKRVDGAPVSEWVCILSGKHKGRVATAEFTPDAWSYFLSRYENMVQPSSTEAHKKTLVEAQKRGWKVPSCRVIQRRLKALGLTRDAVSERYRKIDI